MILKGQSLVPVVQEGSTYNVLLRNVGTENMNHAFIKSRDTGLIIGQYEDFNAFVC